MTPLHPVLASPSVRANMLKVAGLGLISAAAGLYAAPDRLWANVLLAGYFTLSVSLGALVFLAIQVVTDSSWSRGFQRVTESLSAGLWVGLAVTALAVVFGAHSLWGWVHAGGHAAAGHAAAQELWLSHPFQLARLAVYAVVWLIFGYGLIRRVRAERTLHSFTEGHRGFAAVFLAVFALTFTSAGMDWIMTLEPKWFSTIFGIYLFAGTFLCGLAAIAVMLSVVRGMDVVSHVVSPGMYHDLGKLMFGFSCFWAYIWFCQYLLIWYTNMPEETSYFVLRTAGPWGLLTALAVAMNWVIPFFALMTSTAKKSPKTLFRVGVCILFGHWLDLYIVVMPRFLPDGPDLASWELGLFIGAVAALGWAVSGFWDADLEPVRVPVQPMAETLHK